MRSKKRATSERFTTARKGYDPGEVDIFVAATEHRVDELGAALASARTRVRSLEAEVQTYADREEEFTGPVRIAHQRADAIVAAAEHMVEERRTAAEAEAAEIVATGRAQLAKEAAELDSFRMAIAAEAATLNEIEKRLEGRISRAAAALVELVDAPGGLGPFSHATGSLVEFAQLLHHAQRSGALTEVRIELEEDIAAATIVASGTHAPPTATTATTAEQAPTSPAEDASPAGDETPASPLAGQAAARQAGSAAGPGGTGQANAANSSSMAFN
jgi:cell division septum initiation protein DivIVA